MDIAIYHPWLKEKGGMEKVVLKYAENTEHDVTVLTGYYDPERTFPRFEDIDVREIGLGWEPKGFIDRLLRFELLNIFRKINLDDYDAFLVSTSGPGTSITLRNHSIPTYTYTHTPLRTALPEFYDSYSQDINPLLKPFYGIGVKFFAKLENLAYKHVDKSIANSETTKERMLERSLKHSDDIEVVNPGVETDVEQGELGDYFLYPSRFRRYKRQDLAIEAFEDAELDDFKLVLAGSAQEKEYIQELRDKAGEDVQIETDVSQERWEELYKNSYAVLFLAEKEDWGIVPLEAGAYSKPVIAVNEGGPMESVVHEETGFLSDDTPEAIAGYMEELAQDSEKAEEMGEKGRERARDYSWENFAEKLDSILG